MVIGLLTLAAIPTVIGVAEGVSHQRQENEAKEDEKRMAKFNIDAYCETKSSRAKEVNGRRIVLRNEKVDLVQFAEPMGCDRWADVLE
jgi:hypothetical protein